MMGGGSAAAQGMLLATMIGIAMISFATLTPLGMTMASIFKSYFDSQKLSTPFCGACLNGQTVAYNTVDDCFDCFTEPVPTDLCGPCTTGQFIRYDATNDCLACYTVPVNASISDAVYVCAGCADAQSLFYNATAACFDCATETLTCVGGGACAVADGTGANPTLRSLIAGTNVDITQTSTTTTIDVTTAPDVVRTCVTCAASDILTFNATSGCYDCASPSLSCTGGGTCLVADGTGTNPTIQSIVPGDNINIQSTLTQTTISAEIPTDVVRMCGACANMDTLVYNTTGNCYTCQALSATIEVTGKNGIYTRDGPAKTIANIPMMYFDAPRIASATSGITLPNNRMVIRAERTSTTLPAGYNLTLGTAGTENNTVVVEIFFSKQMGIGDFIVNSTRIPLAEFNVTDAVGSIFDTSTPYGFNFDYENQYGTCILTRPSPGFFGLALVGDMYLYGTGAFGRQSRLIIDFYVIPDGLYVGNLRCYLKAFVLYQQTTTVPDPYNTAPLP